MGEPEPRRRAFKALNPSGWETPDWALTEKVLEGTADVRSLRRDQLCWVIAELTARGYTVRQIAGHVRCSPRHVKRIRALPIVSVMRLYLGEREVALAAEHKAKRWRAKAIYWENYHAHSVPDSTRGGGQNAS